LFRERERLPKHRVGVVGADGVDLKPAIGKKQRAP
jgi:hypothetical protein